MIMTSRKKLIPAITKISQSGNLSPPPGESGATELPAYEVMLGASEIARLSTLKEPVNCLMKVVPSTI